MGLGVTFPRVVWRSESARVRERKQRREMTLKSCTKTLVDDTIRFVGFCEIIGAAAALVFAGTMVEENSVLSSGDWKHLSRSWFVYSIAGYGLVMLVSGFLGMFGSATCKGFCLDLHALVTILVVSLELVLVGIYVADRTALEKVGAKDPYGDMTSAISWVEENRVGSIAIVATVFSVQVSGFLLAWVVRMCCGAVSGGSHEEFEEFEYEYAPLPLNREAQEEFLLPSNQDQTNASAPSLSSLQKKYRDTFLAKPLAGNAGA